MNSGMCMKRASARHPQLPSYMQSLWGPRDFALGVRRQHAPRFFFKNTLDRKRAERPRARAVETSVVESSMERSMELLARLWS